MIRGVTAAQYPAERDRILPFLKNFVDRSHGEWRLEEAERDILNRERQVWCINDYQAVAMTHLTAEAVRIDACGGVRRHEWQEELDDELRAWGRALGKKRVIATVRPGWARFGKARGYREIHREMMLEI